MKTFRVPVVTDIQLKKYVEVEAETLEAAETEVRGYIKEAANLDDFERSDDPIVDGLTYVDLLCVVQSLELGQVGDLEWRPTVSDLSITVDLDEMTTEVEEASAA
jgi:hypothetical protein